MPSNFSTRYGPNNQENPIRDDAPEQIRVGLREVLTNIGLNTPSLQRSVICKALRIRPEPNNWTDYPNVDFEVNEIIHGLIWYKFYDLCERLNSLEDIKRLGTTLPNRDETLFSHYLNILFSDENVIYRMNEKGEIHPEGTQQFEESVTLSLEKLLSKTVYLPPLEQYEKALGFRKALPPDYANAIKESVNSLEAILQIILNRPGVALPQMLDSSISRFDSHIKRAMKELYGLGCAIQGGRHAGVGGLIPSALEADWAIHLSSACISYAILSEEITH